jgi:5'-nucleotidase
MFNRRDFIKTGAAAGMMAGFGTLPLESFAAEGRHLVILHTNDVHSQIEAFPENHKQYPGLGGAAARKAIIDQIRSQHSDVLLFDSGDIFQGTPYFNFFGGELEFKLMSQMGYNAATLGNHDFDGGIKNIEKQLFNADFPFICSNYNFNNTVLNGKTFPYKVFHVGALKVGVLGIGIALKGLVPDQLYEDTVYMPPIEMANQYAAILKEDLRCDLVVCLSHLGYKYANDRISDVLLAENTRFIDIILGGHTHTFMEKPDIRKNLDGESVMVHQAGWAGVQLGRLDIFFEKKLKKKSFSGQTVIVDKKSIPF